LKQEKALGLNFEENNTKTAMLGKLNPETKANLGGGNCMVSINVNVRGRSFFCYYGR